MSRDAKPMHGTPEQELLSEFRNCGEFVSRGVVTAQEFISKAFHHFACADRVNAGIIPALWQSVPESMHADMAAAIRSAAQPDYRWRPFYIGPGRRQTDEERRQHAELGSARIQAWAIEFVRFLDSRTARQD